MLYFLEGLSSVSTNCHVLTFDNEQQKADKMVCCDIVFCVTLLFFYASLRMKVLMIGDDLVNDVGGAQQCGIKGVQVRTGKYRSVLQ